MADEWRGGIEHVVLLMLENRSFDHMLGDLKQVLPRLDGIDRNAARPNANRYERRTYPQEAGASRVLTFDPKHEHVDVMLQLANENGGFVEDATRAHRAHGHAPLGPTDWREVMRYHALEQLPVLQQLAQDFVVCDGWFSSLPGPTWPNRLFALSGTSLGRVKMPEGLFDLNLHWYDQTTIFDRLDERQKSWKVYVGDYPLSMILVHQLEWHNAARYASSRQFFVDCLTGSLPAFSFIEPAYMSPHANDDHPPHDVLAGESLVADVYEALRASSAWENSLLVVVFDEHGGFYDHRTPPPATPPDHHTEEYTFTQLGVRVPAVLVSPWLDAGVYSETVDHTALLAFLVDLWGLGSLGARTASYAQPFATLFRGAPRTDAPRGLNRLPANAAPVATVPLLGLNGNQAAMVAHSHALEARAGEDPAIVAGRLSASLTGPQSQIDAAIDRANAFIARAKAKSA